MDKSMHVARFTPLAICAFALVGCHAPGVQDGVPQAQDQHELVLNLENALATRLMDDGFEAWLDASPQLQTRLGLRLNDGRWDELSDRYSVVSRPRLFHSTDATSAAVTERWMHGDPLESAWNEIRRSVDPKRLNAETSFNLALFHYNFDRDQAALRYRAYNDPVSQLPQEIPAFLIDIHPARTRDDLDNYISRLKGVLPLFTQLVGNLHERADASLLPPRFAMTEAIAASKRIINGKPFTERGEDSPLLADFREKCTRVDMTPDERKELIAAAANALTESVGPAYRSLIDVLTDLAGRATDEAGAWRMSDGEAFYAETLKSATSTDLTAEQIHEIGLREVSRIHGAMIEAMHEASFTGTLPQFFEFLRADPRFRFAETPEGKQAYLDLAVDLLGGMSPRLEELVGERPAMDLVVTAVEPFEQATAPAASYDVPAPDGSRPGILHLNLARMADMPTWDIESLVYRDGVPGMHLALSRAMANETLPRFRRFARIPAWEEGWALYAAGIPKEIGSYRDPHSDFGRLAMELHHAALLVVDTGIHARRWTLGQAIAYLDDNTPATHERNVRAAERTSLAPGQATAATIGLLKFRELRKRAEDRLGERFDARQFHEWILRAGPLPLDLLEEEIVRHLALSPES